MKHGHTLSKLYSFPGFHAAAQLKGVFGDPAKRVITLQRKKSLAPARAAVTRAALFMIDTHLKRGTWAPVAFASCSNTSGCG